MAILFDFFRSPSPRETDSEKMNNYHARVVGSQTIDMDSLIDHISRRCTLSKGDIQAVIGELGDEIRNGLCEGNRVSIPGIGSFYLSLTAPKDADPVKTHAQHVHVKQIEFRPDCHLKKQVENLAVLERCKEKNHSAILSEAAIDELLAGYFQSHSFITRQGFEKLCHFTKPTALRHLHRLQDEGKLKNENTLHHPIYRWVDMDHKGH